MNGFSLARVMAVLTKEFVQLRRDRLTYAMILAIPIVQLLLFGYAINSDPRHLPAAALVQDTGPMARSVLSAIANSGYLDIVETASSPADLEDALRHGRVQFAITIPADFSRRVVRHDRAQILIDTDATDPMATGGPAAAVSALPQLALKRELTGPLTPTGSTGPPFEVVIHRRYNPEGQSSQNIVPGLLAVILSMTLVMITAMGVTRELERGTMEGLLATPVRPLEVMIGKLTPYVVVGLLQALLILTLGRLLFHVPMEGSWLTLGIGLLLFIVGSLSLGFVISTAVRSQLQAVQVSIFYMLPSILMSGFMFPFRGMPAWARAIGELMPVTHFLVVIRGTLLKGLGFAELWPSLLALAGFVLAMTLLAMARYRTTLD
ncbi:MAG: ABC transporter permease [Parcubacteria group bacterium]